MAFTLLGVGGEAIGAAGSMEAGTTGADSGAAMAVDFEAAASGVVAAFTELGRAGAFTAEVAAEGAANSQFF